MITPTVLEFDAKLNSQKPRGYQPGSSYDNAGGLYEGQQKSVLVSERVAYKTGPLLVNRDVINTGLHEFGHAYDDCRNFLSCVSEFMHFYNEDFKNVSNSNRKKYQYFIQSGEAGPSELFALYLAEKGGIARKYTALKKLFPQSYGYMKKLIDKS